MARIVRDSGRDAEDPLGPPAASWELARLAADACAHPDELPATLRWIPAPVPGTVAQALRDAGLWREEHPAPLHGHDHWYRVRLDGQGPRTLHFAGLAGPAEAWLGGVPVLLSESMYIPQDASVELRGEAWLHLCFRSLDAVLRGRRKGRWRPKLVRDPAVRTVRATLLGHMPGWCPDIHVVGPWRPVELRRERAPRVDLRTGLRDGAGTVALRVSGLPADGAVARVGGTEVPLCWRGEALEGTAALPDVQPWWPHTHGTPALHPVSVLAGGRELDLGPVGFRNVQLDRGADGQGFGLRVNNVPVFARGACWTPPDLVSLADDRDAAGALLRLVRDAGMNMVRVPGTGAYEGDAFYGLCDELGILVWQDFAFASLDYPDDSAFSALVDAEARAFLDRTQASPCLAVLCGGSEVAQQPAMLGLDPARWSSDLFDGVLPDAAAAMRPDLPYWPHSPGGGDLPFSTDSGASHYYGVGAYLRPPDDARRARVRFASECLALANVPCAETADESFGAVPVAAPGWKAGVPRDGGASWDFEDVRDHYLHLFAGADPRRLRTEDPDRYLDLSRAVSCELGEAVFSEWRRVGSCCAGGIVWLLRDLRDGPGWGLVDRPGRPKPAWHGLRRVLRPRQVLLTDEGLNGLGIHVLNEADTELRARLLLDCLRDGEVPVASAGRDVVVPPRGAVSFSSAALLGRFFDAAYAYRFGPPAHQVTTAHLLDEAGTLLAEACHVPGPVRLLPPGDPGLQVECAPDGDGWTLDVRARRFAQHVHVRHPGTEADEGWFPLSPLRPRRIRLRPVPGARPSPVGEVRATNAVRPQHYRIPG